MQYVIDTCRYPDLNPYNSLNSIELNEFSEHMRLTRYFVSGYKNLKDCNVSPKGFHVVTGCNGTGKSNFLEALSFIKLLISGSEEDRASILNGLGVGGTQWTPMSDMEQIEPLFQIEGEIELGETIWDFSYLIKFSAPVMEGPYSLGEELVIRQEFLKAKERGKPGSMKSIVTRNLDGKCIAKLEVKQRNSKNFNVVNDMSALSVLKIHEAGEFEANYPVVHAFLEGVTNARIISLNPKSLYMENRTYTNRVRRGPSGASHFIVSSVNLFETFSIIEASEFHWKQLCYWANTLLRIDKIAIQRETIDVEDDEAIVHKNLLLTQDGKILWPHELSNGSIVVLALLALLLSPRLNKRVLFIEEPEAYIHPKAISDLVGLMKEVAADGSTIIASTHSPVVLNSLNSNQVTLLSFDGGNMAHSHLVADIRQATEVLNRGRINFGDLLQSDFQYQ